MRHLRQKIEALLARPELTMGELLDGVNDLLPVLAPSQDRGTVRGTLDARTVRYYATRGLIPKPSAYTRGRAHYGPTHVLRLAIIKRMQTEHLSLKAITARLGSLSDTQILHELIGPQTDSQRGAKATSPNPAPLDSTQEEDWPTPPAPPAATHKPAKHLPLPLGSGAVVNVPASLMKDTRARIELANSLEALAAWLRATTDEPS